MRGFREVPPESFGATIKVDGAGSVTLSPVTPFAAFPSIARLCRDMIVTEKIDGTNAQVHITEDGQVLAGSRSRWITPEA